MVKLQAFQIAAREGGFVKVSEVGEGNVLWFSSLLKNRCSSKPWLYISLFAARRRSDLWPF